MDLHAVAVCRHVCSFFQPEREIEGQIHSVFRRACNLDFNLDFPDRPPIHPPLIAWLAADAPVKPMAVLAPTPGGTALAGLGLQPGQVVRWDGTRLLFPAAEITLDLNGARVADCRPGPVVAPAGAGQFGQNLAVLRKVLPEGNSLGLLPVISCYETTIGQDPPLKEAVIESERSLRAEQSPWRSNPYTEYVWPALQELLQSAGRLDSAGCAAGAARIAGCGPGLTPAGDDLLAGFMLGLIYASQQGRYPIEAAAAINSAIAHGTNGKTTRLSGEMLSFAAQGEAAEDVHRLLELLHSETAPGLAAAARGVLRIGETSGADLLAGIYLSLHLSL